MKKPRVIGRYALHERISSGGMATVYYGRLLGPVGFSRTVAIKQLHPQFSRDPDFVSMFVDEAHVAARIRHPNVVPVLDIIKDGRELYIVMEYVLGASFAEVIGASARAEQPIPHRVMTAIVGGCLRGLHAAHETRDDAGELLGIVHRDVSPANVLVGRDGLARVLDFGIAKAASRAQITRHGELKGKVGYMAPEQLRTGDVDRRADVYSVGVTLWEALTRRRAFAGDSDEIFNLRRRAHARLPPPSRHDDLLAPFDDIVMRALAQDPDDRFASAEALADALEGLAPPAPIREVSQFVAALVGDKMEERAQISSDLERVASPSEVRAAIRDEVGVSVDDAPSISVSTWTDPSIDILALVDDDGPPSAALEATTRDLPPRESEEPSTQVAPAPSLAASTPIDLVREVPVVTPGWNDAPPIRSDPGHDKAAHVSPIVVGAAVVAVMVGGAVALSMLDDEPQQPPPAATAADTSPPLRPSFTVPITTPTPPPPATAEQAVSSAAPSVSASTSAPAPRRKKQVPVDPFDSLGGRH